MAQPPLGPHRPRLGRRSMYVPALLVLFGSGSGGAVSRGGGGAVDLPPGSIADETGPEVAVAWSELGYEIAYEEDQFLTFKGQRALAMMHLAVHDALQAIEPLYEVYAYEASEPGASAVAAVSQAAHDVLVSAYPDRQADLEAALSQWLGQVGDDGARSGGITVGSASAAAVIAEREGDGWDAQGSYEFVVGPGRYQTTPPWDSFTLQPGFRYARPFTFDDPGRFRPPPPPDLTSVGYADALNEVRAHGDSMSTVRTADQTAYAVWWMEFSESGAARVARRFLMERDLNLWEANRALAHLYIALYDGYVSNWDSKYEYNHWRPYTAIRAAGDDGNPATEPDPDWVPLRTTPPFPEYASAHAVGCAAAFEVLSEVFGDDVAFENTSLTAPAGMATRSFTSFSAAAQECGDSRVQLGWHYRYAVDAGLEAGRRVARHVLETSLVPR